MHGVHPDNLFALLRDGFCKDVQRGGPRARFGQGFYFYDCVTKAIAAASETRTYHHERVADQAMQPLNTRGASYYILLCAIACGTHGVYDVANKQETLHDTVDCAQSDSIYKCLSGRV